MATEHNLYTIMGDVNVSTEFEMLEVKVPAFFSALWVSRHLGRDVTFDCKGAGTML